MKKHLSPRLIVSRLAQAICLHFLFLSITSNLLAQTGVLDVTFGNKGKVITQIGDSNAVMRAVAIQPDGKIVAAGFTTKNLKHVFALARYTSLGALDSSFGSLERSQRLLEVRMMKLTR
jgi:uncharacterized delta-60 repeat protein